MLKDAADEVIGDADVKDAVASIGKDVNEAAAHSLVKQGVDARHKAGHDVGGLYRSRRGEVVR